MCCECHFMLTLSNIVVLPVMYVECTLPTWKQSLLTSHDNSAHAAMLIIVRHMVTDRKGGVEFVHQTV